jgi:hypothetical protein
MAENEGDKAQERQAGLISAANAAKLLLLSPERIRQLVKAGYIPPPVSHGQYYLVGAVQGYIRFLKDEERRASKSQADTRVRDARAQEIEVRIAEKTRELIPLSEALDFSDRFIGFFIKELKSLPARCTRDLSQRRLLEDIVDDVLARGSKLARESGEALREGRDLDATDAEDAPGSMGGKQSDVPADERRAGSARSEPDAVHDRVVARNVRGPRKASGRGNSSTKRKN